MTGTPVLELDRVTKECPGDPPLKVLHAVSLTIAEGELVAVLGPSGSELPADPWSRWPR